MCASKNIADAGDSFVETIGEYGDSFVDFGNLRLIWASSGLVLASSSHFWIEDICEHIIKPYVFTWSCFLGQFLNSLIYAWLLLNAIDQWVKQYSLEMPNLQHCCLFSVCLRMHRYIFVHSHLRCWSYLFYTCVALFGASLYYVLQVLVDVRTFVDHSETWTCTIMRCFLLIRLITIGRIK